jgi:hypothetical protein
VSEAQEHVLALLQEEPPQAAITVLTALNDSVWRKVIDAAESLGVAPLLLGRADTLGLDMPIEIRRELTGILQTHTARNLGLLREFDLLARALVEGEIAFIPVKGVHLCTALYENIGERPIWDIDVLVRLEQMREALKVIEATGYRASRPFDLDLEVRNYHHVPVFLKRDAPPLEIHWTLLNPRFQNGLNWQELWERSVVEQVGEANAHVLSTDDLLVYLCAHVAYQHVYIDALRSLYDIKLLVEKRAGDLDWGAITARAQTWGLANSMYLSLRLTDELLGCRVPESAWPALLPADFTEGLLEAARRRVLEHSDRSPVVSAVWSRRSFWQRVRGLWGRLMVPRAVLAGRYHLPPDSKRVNLYYFVRAWDLLRVHGPDLLDLLLGRRSQRQLALRESDLVAYLKWWH